MGVHVPVRECICCRNKQEKQTLYKIVKQGNEFFVDETQKMQGRGAYICKSCILNPKAFVKRPLDRAFRQKVPQEIYNAIAALNKGAEEQ